MTIYKIPENLKTIIFDIDATLYTNPEYAQSQIDVLIKRYGKETGISEEEAQKNDPEAIGKHMLETLARIQNKGGC